MNQLIGYRKTEQMFWFLVPPPWKSRFFPKLPKPEHMFALPDPSKNPSELGAIEYRIIEHVFGK